MKKAGANDISFDVDDVSGILLVFRTDFVEQFASSGEGVRLIV